MDVPNSFQNLDLVTLLTVYFFLTQTPTSNEQLKLIAKNYKTSMDEKNTQFLTTCENRDVDLFQTTRLNNTTTLLNKFS